MAIARSMVTTAALLVLAGCGPRVLIATGTTLGLKATPGDGQSRPPQVTLGYKRAEVALVPTDGKKATQGSDAYSVLAVFDFRSEWFGKTELASFIGSGNAARDIQGEKAGEYQFMEAFADPTVGPVSQAIQDRRIALMGRLGSASDDDVPRILASLHRSVPEGQKPRDELQDVIADADSDADFATLDEAFARLGR